MLKGQKISEEHKNKIRIANTGKTVSAETRMKMSSFQKGKHNSLATEFKKGEHRSPSTEFKKGDAPWIAGKHHSEEIREKLPEFGMLGALKRWEGHAKVDLKELRRFHIRKRRAREANAEGSHTNKEWENLKKLYKFMCLCCKRQEPEIKLTEDHIIPLSKGGTDFIWNIQPLCRSCNSKKNIKTTNYIYFANSQTDQEKLIS